MSTSHKKQPPAKTEGDTRGQSPAHQHASQTRADDPREEQKTRELEQQIA
jgi:hypothetical protein